MEIKKPLNCRNIKENSTVELQKHAMKTCRVHTSCLLPQESIYIFNQTTAAVKSSTNVVFSKNYEQCFLSKLSSSINFYMEQMINLLSSAQKKKRIKCSEEVNARFIIHSKKVFVFLVSLVLILQLLPLVSATKPLGNPYKILGVSKYASIKEIRKAYLNLVKEW